MDEAIEHIQIAIKLQPEIGYYRYVLPKYTLKKGILTKQFYNIRLRLIFNQMMHKLITTWQRYMPIMAH
jgi:hypothetical protein